MGEWILVGSIETSEQIVTLVSLLDALAHISLLGHWRTRYVVSIIFEQLYSVVIIAFSLARLTEMQDFATAAVNTLAPTKSIE